MGQASRRRRKKTKIDRTLTLDIESLSHEGRGIARHEGKTVFVAGALPGEQVEARIVRSKRQFEEASVLQVLRASADRVKPPCQHADICGGCSLQHMHPVAQRAHKQQVLAEHLRHFGGETSQPIDGFLPPIISPSEGYRRKARLACKYVIKKEQVLVGFREKGSAFVADIESCSVLQPEVGQQITALRQLIGQMKAKVEIPQIEIAVGDQITALVVRHLSPLSVEDQQLWIEFCQQHHMYLYLQPGGLDSLHRVWPIADEGPEQSMPTLMYSLPEWQLSFEFQPVDFVQVNATVNQSLVRQALALLNVQPGEQVLDLFCGLGNFSLPIARVASRVVGLEGAAEMVARAESNARLNHIDHAEFYCADLFQPNLQAHYQQAPWWTAWDAVLIDPPRSGAEQVLAFLTEVAQPKRIVYVSCNTATLARDVKILSEQGYQLKTTGIADMFPHTAHAEAIAYLESAH